MAYYYRLLQIKLLVQWSVKRKEISYLVHTKLRPILESNR